MSTLLWDQIAPFAAQMDFDNAGFLVAGEKQQVTRLLVSLDITEEVVWGGRGAGELNSLSPTIPLFFILPAALPTRPGRTNRIGPGGAGNCRNLHTRIWTPAVGGVSDAPGRCLGPDGATCWNRLTDRGGGDRAYGRTGVLRTEQCMDAAAYAAQVKRRWGANGYAMWTRGVPSIGWPLAAVPAGYAVLGLQAEM